ncbi:hypothetical protein Dimus_028743, partial [Dionaea muscipula]
RREKQEEFLAAGTADDYEINTVEAHVISSSADMSPIGREDVLERSSARSKSERWADQDSDEERPKMIQFDTLPPITINHYLLPGEYKNPDEDTSPPEPELGSEDEQQALENEEDEASLIFDLDMEPQLLCGQVSAAEEEGGMPETGKQAVQGGQDDDLTDVEEEIDCSAEAKKRGISFQRFLRELYENGNPSIGPLGEPEFGNYDFLVVYSKSKLKRRVPRSQVVPVPPPAPEPEITPTGWGEEFEPDQPWSLRPITWSFGDVQAVEVKSKKSEIGINATKQVVFHRLSETMKKHLRPLYLKA